MPKKTRKKKSSKKRIKRGPTAREAELDAALGEAVSAMHDLRSRLDEKERELEEMSNSIKASAVEYYMKLREKYGELPHWTQLEEHDQVEWQKIALSVEELRARRQALMSRNYDRYRQLEKNGLGDGYAFRR